MMLGHNAENSGYKISLSPVVPGCFVEDIPEYPPSRASLFCELEYSTAAKVEIVTRFK